MALYMLKPLVWREDPTGNQPDRETATVAGFTYAVTKTTWGLALRPQGCQSKEEGKRRCAEHLEERVQEFLSPAVLEQLEIVAGTTVTERTMSTRDGIREAIDDLPGRAEQVGGCVEVFVGMKLAGHCPTAEPMEG